MADEKPQPNKGDMLEQKARPKCGIVMPISEIEGCSAQHWREVMLVVREAADQAGFDSDIVSNSNEIGIIQDSIVTNLYENDIVICDVSCKNPNVMLELGMRLAFDKPTIIIKDDLTNYSFDTSPIRHIDYPRDLHHFRLMDFKAELILKLKATHEAYQKDKNYSPFLKHFGTFRVAKIDEKEISMQDYIIRSLEQISKKIERIEAKRTATTFGNIVNIGRKSISNLDGPNFLIVLRSPNEKVYEIINYIAAYDEVTSVNHLSAIGDELEFSIKLSSGRLEDFMRYIESKYGKDFCGIREI